MAVETSELEDFLRSGGGRMILDVILATTPSIAVVADASGHILRVSRHACEISRRSAAEIEGLTIEAFFALVRPADRHGRPLEEHEVPIRRALQGHHVLGIEGFFLDGHGEPVPIVSNAAPFAGSDGKVIGAITSVTDLRAFRALEDELRAAVAEKEMLYRELAHRVKNHLQIISGLVGLETRGADPAVKAVAERIGGRLGMLAATYDRMGQAESPGHIEARPFMQEVVRPYETERVTIVVAAPEDMTLDPDQAAPFGMLLNEAVCNSYKHAFARGRGRIEATLRPAADGRFELEVADDGVGGAAEAASGPSDGMALMRLLARQLGGELTIADRPGGGTRLVASVAAAAG